MKRHQLTLTFLGILIACEGTSAPTESPPTPTPAAEHQPQNEVPAFLPEEGSRMPNLPSSPTAEQEQAVQELVAAARSGHGGGRTSARPEFAALRERFEGLSDEEAAQWVDRAMQAAQNVRGEATACDRMVLAFRAVAGETVSSETIRDMCSRIPPEMEPCFKPPSQQQPAEATACERLVGTASFFAAAPPVEEGQEAAEYQAPHVPVPRSEQALRRLLGPAYRGSTPRADMSNGNPTPMSID